MNHNTTGDWNSYFREVCANALCSRPNRKICGPNKIMEVDESHFTRRKSNVGRVLLPKWVLVGLSREIRGCFLTPIPDRTAETLMAAIENGTDAVYSLGRYLGFFSWRETPFRQVVNVDKQRFMRMLGLTGLPNGIDKQCQQKIAKKSKMAAEGMYSIIAQLTM